jgi:hypothetical protein
MYRIHNEARSERSSGLFSLLAATRKGAKKELHREYLEAA